MVNAGQSYNQFTRFPELRFAVDIFPNRGPLGGIYTGLTASTSVKNLVVACDMPFLNVDLLNYMVAGADGYDIVVPRFKIGTENLHAVYSKRCLPCIEELLKKNELKIFKLHSELKVRYVEEAEIDRFDPDHLSFLNVNTEADLKKAKELLKRE